MKTTLFALASQIALLPLCSIAVPVPGLPVSVPQVKTDLLRIAAHSTQTTTSQDSVTSTGVEKLEGLFKRDGAQIPGTQLRRTTIPTDDWDELQQMFLQHMREARAVAYELGVSTDHMRLLNIDPENLSEVPDRYKSAPWVKDHKINLSDLETIRNNDEQFRAAIDDTHKAIPDKERAEWLGGLELPNFDRILKGPKVA